MTDANVANMMARTSSFGVKLAEGLPQEVLAV